MSFPCQNTVTHIRSTQCDLSKSYRNQSSAFTRLFWKFASLNGTFAFPKSVVSSALRAASVRLSYAISGCVPPTSDVNPSWWSTGHTLKYRISGLVPSRLGDVVVEKSPCPDAATPRIAGSALFGSSSQTTMPSQSWRWPIPSEGSSCAEEIW